MKKPIKITLVEDNADFRKSLSKSLTAIIDFEIIADYPDCEKAEEEMLIQLSDVVLLDISLPGKNGIVFIDWLLKMNSELLIIMLTVNYDNSYIFDSIKKGAVGFLIKSATTDEIIKAIYEAVEGGSPMTPCVAREITKEFQKKRIIYSKTEETLTEHEHEILIHLAEGLTYKEIGEKVFLSHHTVNYHLRKIYDKLHVNNKIEALTKLHP